MFMYILLFLICYKNIFYSIYFDSILYMVIFLEASYMFIFLAFFLILSENDITLYSTINMPSEAINTRLHDNGTLVRVVLYGYKHIMCFEL